MRTDRWRVWIAAAGLWAAPLSGHGATPSEKSAYAFLASRVALYSAYEEAEFRAAAFKAAWKEGGRTFGLEEYGPDDLVWLPYGLEKVIYKESYPEPCLPDDPGARCPLASRAGALRGLEVKAAFWESVDALLKQVQGDAKAARFVPVMQRMVDAIGEDIRADRAYLEKAEPTAKDLREFRRRKLRMFEQVEMLPELWKRAAAGQ